MEEEQLVVKDKNTENTTEFVYLGNLLTEENDGIKGIQRRIVREVNRSYGMVRRRNLHTPQ